MVLVSVVMPSYNHERYLPESIESVLNQSYKDFELIIVDDDSVDSSQEIIAAYQKKDQRIRAFFHKKNLGIAKTLNDGIEKTKGKYVALLASDDIWLESKLEKQVSVLNADDSLIVWSEGEIIDAKGLSTGQTFTQMHFAQHKKKSGNIFDHLLQGYGNFVFGSSVIFKRDYFKDIRFCEKLKYYNDYKFIVDLSRSHSFFFLPQALAKYRIHRKNAILLDRESWTRDEITLWNLILKEYGSSISNRMKAYLLSKIGSAQSSLGNKAFARKTFFQAISLDPFRKDVFSFLVFALVSGDDSIAKFFVKFKPLLLDVAHSLSPICKKT